MRSGGVVGPEIRPTPAPPAALPTTAPRSAYRPDIDGLRAVAVLLVVAYHYGIGFPGGYIGVDLFFVVSGYLIASIFSRLPTVTFAGLFAFYGRRVKRLMPAFVFVAAVTALVSGGLLLPDDWQALLKSIRESLVFRANRHFEHETTGYFASTAAELPWLHTWSLSVEWQFYLAFPLVAVAIRALPSARWRHPAWTVVTVLGAAGSAALVAADPAQAYFSTVARAFEFALGAWVATLPDRPGRRGRSASLGGVAALVGLAWWFDATTPFPGLPALAVCAIGCVLIATGRDGSVLAHPGLAALGRRSYAIYLWHWPVVAWMNYVQRPASLLSTGLALGIVLLASEATHRWIERPGMALTWRPARAIAMLCVLPFACAALALAFVRHHQGFPQRLGAEARHAYENLSRFDERQANHCHDLRDGDSEACAFGDLTGARTALLVGDSHARHFRPFVQGLADEAHVKVYGLTESECPVLEGTDGAVRAVGAVGSSAARSPGACSDAAARAYAAIREKRYAYVFLAQRWIGYPPAALAKLDASLATIVASGARPVLMLSVAEDGTNPKDCFNRHLKLRRASTGDCAIRADDGFAAAGRAHFAELVLTSQRRYPSLIVIDPRAAQCHDGRCDTVIDATPIYADTHHLDAFGSAMLGERYRRLFGNPLLRAPP